MRNDVQTSQPASPRSPARQDGDPARYSDATLTPPVDVIEDASGDLAHGYRTPFGEKLHPEIVIGNKAHARTAMADLLRQYAASLRLG